MSSTSPTENSSWWACMSATGLVFSQHRPSLFGDAAEFSCLFWGRDLQADYGTARQVCHGTACHVRPLHGIEKFLHEPLHAKFQASVGDDPGGQNHSHRRGHRPGAPAGYRLSLPGGPGRSVLDAEEKHGSDVAIQATARQQRGGGAYGDQTENDHFPVFEIGGAQAGITGGLMILPCSLSGGRFPFQPHRLCRGGSRGLKLSSGRCSPFSLSDSWSPSPAFMSPRWSAYVAVFAVYIAVILVRPRGLFG